MATPWRAEGVGPLSDRTRTWCQGEPEEEEEEEQSYLVNTCLVLVLVQTSLFSLVVQVKVQLTDQ